MRQKPHGWPLGDGTPWSQLASLLLALAFACANASSGCRMQTWSNKTPHRTGTRNKTLYPLGASTEIPRPNPFAILNEGLVLHNSCQWCPICRAGHSPGAMLAGRACRSATHKSGNEGRGGVRFEHAPFGRICRCAALALLQAHSASSAQQNAATPNKGEKINHSPNEQEKKQSTSKS